jgi:hypothetical protein
MMLATVLFLFAYSFRAQGHVHISGVPVLTGAPAPLLPYRRLFVPIDPNFCNAGDQQQPVLCLQGNSQGTPYCSSLLSIPTATM